MKIKMWLVALVVFAVIFGGIGLSILLGSWATTSDKEPVKFETGDFAGEYNPEDIRGSYTFQDVAEIFAIDLSVLFDAFGIPADTDGSAIKTKDIETAYGEAEIGNGSVQLFVGLYKGLPIALADTYLTPRAAELILEANANLTQEQIDYIATHQVDVTLLETEAVDAAATAVQEHEEGEENSVKGGTTFQQVLDGGLTQEQIEAIIGGAMPAANMAVRDYCTANGLSFSEIKATLTAALEAME